MVARRFIVEQGPEAVANVLGKLDRAGRFASFDLLGEAVLSEEEAQRYIHGYVNLLASLGNHRLAGQRTARGALKLEVSLKLTALTAQFRPEDPEGTLDRVRPALERLFAAARDAGVGVTVDAEQYPYRDLTWRIVRETLGSGRPFESWPDAGVVVQAYLRDVEEHVRDVAAFISHRGVPMGVRLVKGAYWDHEVISAEQNGWPASVFQNKGATDIAYERAVRTLLEAAPGVRLAVASHNLRTHAHAEAVAESLGLPRHAVEHQTLHRTSEEVSRALADVGWVSRDYVPVGELNPGMAYLVRRILENTSQVGVLIKARAREDVEELLRPPAAGADDTAYRHGRHASGFANTPTVRLFDDGQRGDFRRALNDTRERWGGTYPLRVGGEELTTNAPEPSISPSHHDPAHPVGWVHRASPAEVTKALRLANAAAPAWSRRSLDERSRIGRRAAELLRERKMEVAAWVVHEGGRSWREALADVEEGIDHIEWSARQLLHLAPRIEGVYRPRGVVACIPPWNFPVALPAASVGAALMAGNAVILKSAEHTPIIAGLLTDVLHDAGVPRDVLIHLPGPGSTVGAALVDSSDVDLVAFTGSKSTGLSILERAARVHPARGGIKRVVAEMGGKNAIVVYPDADMDEAIAGILASAFGHAGQKCSACSRVLVHRDVYPTLQRRLIEAARSLPVGPADEPGTAVNPVISPRAREQIAAYASIARDEGRVLLDRIEERAGDACTIGPLLVEIDARNAAASRIAHEEVFGPVLPLIPFSSEEEALSLLDDTSYGLTLGIFSRSPSTIERSVRGGAAGNIYVNRTTTGARVGIEPFGGIRLSGTGPKAGGEEALMAYLTRVEPFRAGGQAGSGDGAAGASGAPLLRTWDADRAERAAQLGDAATLLAKRGDVGEALAFWSSAATTGVDQAIDSVTRTLNLVVAAVDEIEGPKPALAIPGQNSYLLWSLPRGVGVSTVDDGASPAALAALVFAPLLAGNGVTVTTTEGPRRFAELLVGALHNAGVPRDVLAAIDTDALALAAGPVHFVACDVGLDMTQLLYETTARTDEAAGQRWIKALLSTGDGPAPGEPGFIRQFALPRAVAVQTLRHGAELEVAHTGPAAG